MNSSDKSIDQIESEDGVKESRKKQKIYDDDDDYYSDEYPSPKIVLSEAERRHETNIKEREK